MAPDMGGGARAAPAADGGSGRIASLDFIRGIAVMGILAANIVAFGQPMTAYMFPGAFTVPHSEAENWMWVAQFVLIDGKMRGLFPCYSGRAISVPGKGLGARGGHLAAGTKAFLARPFRADPFLLHMARGHPVPLRLCGAGLRCCLSAFRDASNWSSVCSVISAARYCI